MTESTLSTADSEIFAAISEENQRQEEHLELIASENYTSANVMAAQGSQMTNKYAEGYAGKRYYGGCEYVDKAEILAIERLKELYQCAYANVQPHSGSQANQAVYLALLNPGDKVLGMNLSEGGHLTHGAKVNFSGKLYEFSHYGVDEKTHLIDYDKLAAQALEEKPKLIVAGISAYSRILDWKRFREIAGSVGAYLMVDMAHISGLVAAGVYPSPLPYADVVTSTTHKTLRGPRGGIILSNAKEELTKKFNSAVFPGCQGGPLMHVIAAKAVAFKEALQPDFKAYARAVAENAKALSEALKEQGLDIVSGGTDNHLMLVDLRPKNATGKVAEKALGRANITCNKNGIPFDPEKPFVTSGIRLGTPAATTRGFGVAEFREVAALITEVLDGLKAANSEEGNAAVEAAVKAKVEALTARFPIYGG